LLCQMAYKMSIERQHPIVMHPLVIHARQWFKGLFLGCWTIRLLITRSNFWVQEVFGVVDLGTTSDIVVSIEKKKREWQGWIWEEPRVAL
jgi:hypothetical protein